MKGLRRMIVKRVGYRAALPVIDLTYEGIETACILYPFQLNHVYTASNWPDLWRDWDTIAVLLLSWSVTYPVIDLTYEGIETIGSTEVGFVILYCLPVIDLTYEGIETRSREQSARSVRPWPVIDLTYEGIETRYDYLLIGKL